jgi:4-hydroxy-tetrahydrodipicolinate synthase
MEIIAAAPVGFSVLSGDDNLTLPLMAAGGHGVISVASHLAAADMVAMCKAVEEGRMDEARRLHYQLMPLCKALNVDTNPIPVKYALARLGRIEEKYRLPLTPLTERQKAEVDQAMKEYGLLK